MKKVNTAILFLLALMSLTVMALIRCSDNNIPPSVAMVQDCYREHAEDIQTIVDFLSSLEYEDIYITDNNGKMLADLTRIQIEDQSVSNAIDRILDSKAYQHINKNGNTISLLQWKGIRDIGCGIAYSVNGTNSPEIEFVTQLTPLSDDGWYYYVSDYNTWRNDQ